MNRQFANMIVHNYARGVYSLCRIDVMEHLFDKKLAAAQETAAAEVAKPNKKGLLSTIPSCKNLPKQNINFLMPSKMADTMNMHFFSLLKGRGEGSVMLVGPEVHTVMYDTSMDSVFPMPKANFCKQSDSISLSITRQSYGQDEHQLYVIGNGVDNGLFEVLNYSRTDNEMERWWCWKPLPCPPLYAPHLPGSHRKLCRPSAAAVVDDTTICVSSVDADATCAFDMVKGEWRQAGRWVLPFHGAAEYVPELGLWFGIDDANGNPQHCLHAFDLSSSSPPVEQHTWNYLDCLPDEWLPRQRHLVNLGSGKFCIGTSFQNIAGRTTCTSTYSSDGLDDDIVANDLTVLTGVEVVRSCNGPQIIKHKSYSFEGIRIHCVL